MQLEGVVDSVLLLMVGLPQNHAPNFTHVQIYSKKGGVMKIKSSLKFNVQNIWLTKITNLQ